MMTDEEQQILNFLGTSPETYFARREIARKAVRRQVYEENQHWADAAIASLLLKGLIQQNDGGQLRLKQDETVS
jgi:hypothetical protein